MNFKASRSAEAAVEMHYLPFPFVYFANIPIPKAAAYRIKTYSCITYFFNASKNSAH